MKVTFDSNVWQQVVAPEDYKSHPDFLKFCAINNAIKQQIIVPYISETIFSLEAVRRNDRKKIFSHRGVKSESIDESNINRVERKVLIKGNTVLNLDENVKLKRYLKMASELAFNIVPIARLGKIVNEEVDKCYNIKTLWPTDDSFWEYTEEVSKILSFIDSIGAGKSQLDNLVKEYGQSTTEGIKNAPKTLDKKIQKAIAEWADGDTVAVSIALKCDYLCTHDKSKDAGTKSVFHENNIQFIRNNYSFNTITISDLEKLISR